MENENIIKELKEMNSELKAIKEHLKKYTAPVSRKVYYEKNKEVIKERVKKYNQDKNYKPTPEQKKEYNKQAYLKRKEKLTNKIEENSNNKNIKE